MYLTACAAILDTEINVCNIVFMRQREETGVHVSTSSKRA